MYKSDCWKDQTKRLVDDLFRENRISTAKN